MSQIKPTGKGNQKDTKIKGGTKKREHVSIQSLEVSESKEPPTKKPSVRKNEELKGSHSKKPKPKLKTAETSKETTIEEAESDKFKTIVYKDLSRGKKKYIGAHVSMAGGIENAIVNAYSIDCGAFALDLKSKRKWILENPLTKEHSKLFIEYLSKYGYHPNHVLPHGSYLMNLGSPKLDNLNKSRENLTLELNMANQLGLKKLNFHLGSSLGEISAEQSMNLIIESINLSLAATSNVMAVLETGSRSGFSVGGQFEEIKYIIDGVIDKSRVGVCIDTCHTYAAGYDLKNHFDEVMNEFNDIVGLKYLVGMHLNDSKDGLGSRHDRHELIARGKLGKEFFAQLLASPISDSIPLIIETSEIAGYTFADQINFLYSLI